MNPHGLNNMQAAYVKEQKQRTGVSYSFCATNQANQEPKPQLKLLRSSSLTLDMHGDGLRSSGASEPFEQSLVSIDSNE